MRVELTKRFLATVRALPESDVAAVDAALSNLPAIFGRPHQHAGASVRAIRPPVYEMRASLALRIVFVRSGDVLKVDFVGNHDDVRRYLRSLR